MGKIVHHRVIGPDCRDMGQTVYEYTHTTSCGYVRDNLTMDESKVTCKNCLKKLGIKQKPKVDEQKKRWAELITDDRLYFGDREFLEAQKYLESIGGNDE